MKTKFGLRSVFGVIAVLILSACANTGSYPSNSGATGSGNTYAREGVVQSIERVQLQEDNGIADSGIGIGTIAGAVIGGVVGNQIGAGRGNTVATVAGVAGGAYVGHEIESRNRKMVDKHKITIRMRDGAYQTVMEDPNTDFRVGDRVRFENGNLQRY